MRLTRGSLSACPIIPYSVSVGMTATPPAARISIRFLSSQIMGRHEGVEPSMRAPQALVLPLHQCLHVYNIYQKRTLCATYFEKKRFLLRRIYLANSTRRILKTSQIIIIGNENNGSGARSKIFRINGNAIVRIKMPKAMRMLILSFLFEKVGYEKSGL